LPLQAQSQLLSQRKQQQQPPQWTKKSATACPWQVRTIAQPVLAQHAPVHPQWITKATHGHLLTQAHAKQWTFQVIAWGL
jgi:hypothetical protein